MTKSWTHAKLAQKQTISKCPKGLVKALSHYCVWEKRMKINEIIFIRTKILWNASVQVSYIWRTSSVFSVCLEYAYRIKHVQYAQNFWACLKKNFCLAVCHRTRSGLKRIQPMPNVPLGPSVYQRMSDIFHTLAYASTIRNSVTGPLERERDVKSLARCWLIIHH
jgi:hypothetical protein